MQMARSVLPHGEPKSCLSGMSNKAAIAGAVEHTSDTSAIRHPKTSQEWQGWVGISPALDYMLLNLT